jgi:hypothetical protein
MGAPLQRDGRPPKRVAYYNDLIRRYFFPTSGELLDDDLVRVAAAICAAP